MEAILSDLRGGTDRFGSFRVTGVTDYLPGDSGLPPSNMICFSLQGNAGVIVRPSGTEPKLRIYLSVYGTDAASASAAEAQLRKAIEEQIL